MLFIKEQGEEVVEKEGCHLPRWVQYTWGRRHCRAYTNDHVRRLPHNSSGPCRASYSARCCARSAGRPTHAWRHTTSSDPDSPRNPSSRTQPTRPLSSSSAYTREHLIQCVQKKHPLSFSFTSPWKKLRISHLAKKINHENSSQWKIVWWISIFWGSVNTMTNWCVLTYRQTVNRL